MLDPHTTQDMPVYVGVDIGGTGTRIGVFQSLRTADFTLIARFLTEQRYEQQMQNIVSAVQSYHADSLAGIGVSIGGRIAKDGRSVMFAPNMPAYIGKPFAQDLSTRCGTAVRLAHDTVCGLLAEKQFGVIRNDDRCAYLTISTGTGAAFQLRKAEAVLTISIDIGHQLLDGNERLCLCGQVGCLETFTGGRQLELRLGHALSQVTDDAFWETFSNKLALGLINFAQLTHVEVIAVSGAIALHNTFLLSALQQKVNARMRGTTLELKQAILGEKAPLVGAALLLETPEETLLH